MTGYLQPAVDRDSNEAVGRIAVRGPVGLYRRATGDFEVMAETETETLSLGVQDAAVSRKHDGRAPVTVGPADGGLIIRNRTSTNPVGIQTLDWDRRLDEGEQLVVTEDCTLEVGVRTRLHATVDRADQTLSPAQLEALGAQPGGSEPEGSAELAAAYGELLRVKAAESVTETRKIAYDIQRFVANNERDDADYEPLAAELETVTDRLDSKRSGALRGSELDQEWREQLDLLADSLERLYR
jgi:hypothetical protein